MGGGANLITTLFLWNICSAAMRQELIDIEFTPRKEEGFGPERHSRKGVNIVIDTAAYSILPNARTKRMN